MKVLTWNINGIRAVQRDKTGMKKLLDSLDADVICFQETKVTRDMLDDLTAIVENYDSYFGFSRKKTGYSGTANYCRVSCAPCKAEEGLTGRLTTQTEGTVGHYGNADCFTSEELNALDDEGRCVITQHKIRLPDGEVKEVVIINVYVPRAGDNEDRLNYKLKFLTLLQLRAEALLRNGIHVIVLGDINTTHTNLDHCDPQSNEEYIRRSSRIWMNQFLLEAERDPTVPKTDSHFADLPEEGFEGGHFSDVFRRLHPQQENAFTNWCTLTGARKTNFGRRLDYILVDSKLAEHVTHCEIMPDVHGSDHCPVIVTLDCSWIPSSSCPGLCSKFMPEFKGQQQTLSAFFSKVSNKNSSDVIIIEPDATSSDAFSSSPMNTARKERPPNKHTISSSVPSSPSKSKRQNSSGGSTKGKKAKLQKEDSQQVNLKFFFGSAPKPKKSPKESEISETPKTSKIDNSISMLSDTLSDSKEEDISLQHRNSSNVKFAATYKSPQFSSPGSQASTLQAWKSILGGLPPPPLCSGHKEPCVLRTVKKEGPNKNKQFYVCCKPDGAPGNPLSRCDFFQWLSQKKK